MLSTFNFLDFFSAFIVLFAVIDPIGAIPIVISVREQGRAVSAFRAVVYSFFCCGRWPCSFPHGYGDGARY